MDIDYGIGSGCAIGTLWMQSTDNNWYEINITGSSGSAAVYVNQTPLIWQDNSLGYQLLQANGGDVYKVYLSGSSGDVSMSIEQTPWPSNLDYKPYLFMRSATDGCFYVVSASVSASVVSVGVNQNSKIFLNW